MSGIDDSKVVEADQWSSGYDSGYQDGFGDGRVAGRDQGYREAYKDLEREYASRIARMNAELLTLNARVNVLARQLDGPNGD